MRNFQRKQYQNTQIFKFGVSFFIYGKTSASVIFSIFAVSMSIFIVACVCYNIREIWGT